MESRPSQTRAQDLVSRFFILQSVLFLLPLATTWLHPVLLGNVRNSQILLVFIFIMIIVKKNITLDALLAWRCPPKLWNALALTSLLSFLATGVTHYLGLRLNGEDFSIFDWMLFNTNYREFMTSPICNMAAALDVCHHFAIHPTYIMIPLAFLHRIFEEPLFLITVHSLALWSAIIPLRALARHFLKHDVLVAAVLLAYLCNAYVGSILNHGFHVEVFFVPFGLALLRAWVARRTNWWVWLLLFLSVKEDGALYMIAMALAQMVLTPRDRRSYALFSVSLAVLALNLLLVQPYFLKVTGATVPSYLRFWGHLGSSKGEIIQTILTQPLSTVTMVLKSHWYILFGALLFVPFLSPLALAAMAPALLIYGLSNISHMREYATYYSAPLIPFLFFGLVEGGHRIMKRNLRVAPRLILIGTFLFALTGGGYQKFPLIAFQALWDLYEARNFLWTQARPLICAQTLLYPHLPYEWRIQPLSTECMQEPAALTVFLRNSRYDSYPIGAREFLALRASVPGMRLVKAWPSGLEIYQTLP
ncbi:MAG TPA: DUF2079 domain-containing protein [Oligoflexus sp.]|uniref:DUF2079 domain-containing protein n=1 Tax=Oligoflexus sp. TaxID=1971216 RepID=UPI002D7ED6C7|nr:DUF2079 domain-containing protein [Oligoflexus sp.]HET9238072.1 DUF2079 domain-containing protein [Oligoflexus sp.]